jgi:general secretion pathway protein L
MLASFVSWWLARMTELLPTALTEAAARPRDGVVVEAAVDGCRAISLRTRGRLEPTNLGAVARRAGRTSVLLHPPADSVLVKNHVVPTVPPRQMEQVLYHELARITPFAAEDLFWGWDGRPKAANRARTDVTLTMVPRKAVAGALAALDDAGLKVDFIEVGPAERPVLLPVGAVRHRSMGMRLTRGLAWGCAALAGIALLLPLGLQALTLHETEVEIARLQPAVSQVETMRRAINAGDAGRAMLQQEMDRTGDVLETLATVTRILPDDTYLTDFSLRDRHLTLSGRSSSAPRLITALSADPAIRNTAFAAPVTRIEGATADLFSIKAEIAK